MLINALLTAAVCVLLLLVALYVVSRYGSWFARQRLKLICFLVLCGILLYALGYAPQNGTPYDYLASGLKAVFSVGRMFTMESDWSALRSTVTDSPVFLLLFTLLMALAMLTTAAIVLSLLGKRLMSRIRLLVLSVFGTRKAVFALTELNCKSFLLAKDALKKGNIVIAAIDTDVHSKDAEAMEQEALSLGILLVEVPVSGSVIKKFPLYKRFFHTSFHVFAIGLDEHDNAAKADEIAKAVLKAKVNTDRFHLHIFVQNPSYGTLFLNSYKPLEIELIDENDIAVRQLFSQKAPLDALPWTAPYEGYYDGTLHLCVIGHSPVAEELIKNAAILAQCEKTKVCVTLVDAHADDLLAAFRARTPQVSACIDLATQNLQPGSDGYYAYLREELRHTQYAFVTSSDSSNNVALTTGLCGLMQSLQVSMPVAVFIPDDEPLHLLFTAPEYRQVIRFGSLQDVYNTDVLVSASMDILARAVNDFYGQLGYGKPWSQLSLFEKNSNRALALHIQSKLHTIGLEYRKGPVTGLYEKCLSDQKFLEILARGEHLRWNAFHYMNGWQSFAGYPDANKDREKKLHACLVSWDELKWVDQKYHSDFQKTDSHLVQNIEHILGKAGFGVYPHTED